MKKIKLESTITLYQNYASFTEQEKKLFEATQNACLNAYAPYSKFKVGAAVLLQNGIIVPGNNQENAVYPNGLCAERVALFTASAQYPHEPIIAVAVCIDYKNNAHFEELVPPCGGCRQSIAEYEYKYKNDIKLYLLGKTETVCVINSIKDILPFVFSGDIIKHFKD